MDITKRNSALDITRIFAMFSVISVHFFLNNGFYSEPMLGKRMLVMTIMRTGFMVCVPLFITLTGYLMSRKTWSRGYYRGVTKTLGIYVLASIACILYKILVVGSEIPFDRAFFSVLNYSGANYAWYIEMYIGLFLLAPFLNAMYNGLPDKKAKTALLLTLIGLTSLPSIVNIFNFYEVGWWRFPIISTEYQQFLPDWWTMLYPVTYYILGAYLREFPVKMKKWLNLLLWAAAVIAFGIFNYYRSYGGYFAWAKYNDWYGLPNLIMTALAFICLTTIPTEGWRPGIKKALMHVSDWCLGAYLMSYVFDNLIYVELNRFVPEMTHRLEWYPSTVLVITVASLAASAALNLIWAGLTKGASALVLAVKDALRTHTELPETAPVLETERLILRPWRDTDAEDLYAYAKDPEVGPRAGWRPHATLEDSRRVIKDFLTGSGLIWAIESKESGHVIGSVGLHRHSYPGIDGDLMLGYSLGQAYWGQGLVPEASRAVIAYAFRELPLKTLTVSHFEGNERSQRVIAKLGFTFVKRLEKSWKRYDGEWMNECIYTMSAAEYAAHASEDAAPMNKVSVNENNLTRMS